MAETTVYTVSDPCYAFISETEVMFGGTRGVLTQMLRDITTNYVIGEVTWEQWLEEVEH